MSLSKEDADERLAKTDKEIDVELEKVGNQVDQIQKKMTELKVILKGKFKNSINLDPSED